jgi:hypothetical protein
MRSIMICARLYSTYYYSDKIRRISWAGHVARITDEKCVQKFVGNPEGTRLFGRYKPRWEDSIKINLK